MSAACFGSISTLTVVAMRDGGPPLAPLLFWRYLLAGVLFLPLARRTVGAARAMPSGARALRVTLLAGLGQTAVAGLSLSALRWIPAATLGFLFYTFPAWVMLFAVLRGTERVDARRVLALALSLGGIVLTVGAPTGGAGGAEAWPGVALALAAALAYALYIPYLGTLQGDTSPEVASTFVCLGTAAYFGVWAVGSGTMGIAYPAHAWTAIAVLAVVCTVVAFQSFLRGLGGLGPVRTAIVSTVEPFWTAVLGALVLAQPLAPATLAGGALIAAAVLLLQLAPRSAAQPA